MSGHGPCTIPTCSRPIESSGELLCEPCLANWRRDSGLCAEPGCQLHRQGGSDRCAGHQDGGECRCPLKPARGHRHWLEVDHQPGCPRGEAA